MSDPVTDSQRRNQEKTSPMNTRELGRTGIQISAIGLGTAQFYDSLYPSVPKAEATTIVKAALDGGINWFDTAEGYGNGESERTLAASLGQIGMKQGEVVIATKWGTVLRTAGDIGRSINDRISNLSPYPIDLYQIHVPIGSFSSHGAQLRAMARLVEAGKIRTVGVSNFSARQMEFAHKELAKYGVTLASNEVQISLVHRKIEKNGVLETAKRLGVTLIGFTPLQSGLLTGRYHADRQLAAKQPRLRRMLAGLSDKNLDRTAPLIDAMGEIAKEHQATIGQVALAWLVNYYGDTVVAIPGASKKRHAEEAAGTLSVALSQRELQRLADLSSAVSR